MRHLIPLWARLHERLLREVPHAPAWAMLDSSPVLALVLGLVR